MSQNEKQRGAGRGRRPSPRPPDTSANELAARAVALYQPLTTRELTPEDGREIVANLGGFLSVLAGWKRREREQAAEARALGGAR